MYIALPLVLPKRLSSYRLSFYFFIYFFPSLAVFDISKGNSLLKVPLITRGFNGEVFSVSSVASQ